MNRVARERRCLASGDSAEVNDKRVTIQRERGKGTFERENQRQSWSPSAYCSAAWGGGGSPVTDPEGQQPLGLIITRLIYQWSLDAECPFTSCAKQAGTMIAKHLLFWTGGKQWNA